MDTSILHTIFKCTVRFLLNQLLIINLKRLLYTDILLNEPMTPT